MTPERADAGLAHAQQRDQAATELVRALLIVNAGGAGALLVFLQAVWKIDTSLVKPTVLSLSILGFGALCAAAFHLLRYEASWYHQNGWSRGWANLRRAYLGAAIGALLAFVVGVVVLAVGIFSVLATGIKAATPEISVDARRAPSIECSRLTPEAPLTKRGRAARYQHGQGAGWRRPDPPWACNARGSPG